VLDSWEYLVQNKILISLHMIQLSSF
jgi:hypothetical protein